MGSTKIIDELKEDLDPGQISVVLFDFHVSKLNYCSRSSSFLFESGLTRACASVLNVFAHRCWMRLLMLDFIFVSVQFSDELNFRFD